MRTKAPTKVDIYGYTYDLHTHIDPALVKQILNIAARAENAHIASLQDG
jgi:hypothetical protein